MTLLVAALGESHAHERHDEQNEPDAIAAQPGLAPGWRALAYPPPEPGSYALPALGLAADGAVLAANDATGDGRRGSSARLAELMDGKMSLLAFIYTRCGDVNGCPLATAVMRSVAKRVAKDTALSRKVRLLSLSFDPAYDTPARLAAHASAFVPPGVDWRFLTTASASELDPVLASYGQTVTRDAADGSAFSHILRVFLIDQSRQIRNIYSTTFLHADTVMSDLRTLVIESDSGGAPVLGQASPRQASLGPGDGRQGYDKAGFTSRSRSVDRRNGEPLDLLGHARAPQLGLPPVPVPANNPLTAKKIALGRKLFYDRRLSHNATLSCAMCHVPEQGFASNEVKTAVGIEGSFVKRNAPTILNVAYLEQLFHDGRESVLERQVWQPMLAANEMGNVSIGAVIDRIAGLGDYASLFEAAFDGRGPGMETVGMAIASYERALVAGDSPFDRWKYGGDDAALSASAKAGFALFTGKAGCARCHLVGESAALLTDHSFHNTGIGHVRAMARTPPRQRVQLAPGVFVDVERSEIQRPSGAVSNDLGRYEVTTDPADRWRYRTPPLRNVALTAPYMHDGSLESLEEVVRFYARGGASVAVVAPNPGLDPRIVELALAEGEQRDLVAFLNSLTSSALETLVVDALLAPIGDTRGAD